MKSARLHLPPAAIAWVLVLACSGMAYAQRRYSLTELPRGEGFDGVTAGPINDSGHVVGIRSIASNAGTREVGFFWSPGTGMINLGEGIRPFALNNHDVVVGRRTDPRDRSDNAFVWTRAEGVRDLADLPGGEPFRNSSSNDASGVNDAGQIAGNVYSGSGFAFVRAADGTLRHLDLPPGAISPAGAGPAVYGISEQGDVIGRIGFDHAVYHAAVWPAVGGFRTLDDLPGGLDQSAAVDRNAAGVTVGVGLIPTWQRAVLWSPDGIIRDLGILPGTDFSGATGINNREEVVGFSGNNGTVEWHAFVWTDSEGMLDLNNLLDRPAEGWLLSMAGRVNSSGQIVVSGFHDGHEAVAVLTPVPEPATKWVALIPAVLALRRRRRIVAAPHSHD